MDDKNSSNGWEHSGKVLALRFSLNVQIQKGANKCCLEIKIYSVTIEYWDPIKLQVPFFSGSVGLGK